MEQNKNQSATYSGNCSGKKAAQLLRAIATNLAKEELLNGVASENLNSYSFNFNLPTGELLSIKIKDKKGAEL
jgi:hypothetical protein